VVLAKAQDDTNLKITKFKANLKVQHEQCKGNLEDDHLIGHTAKPHKPHPNLITTTLTKQHPNS
jgi:hypothetical protein